MSFTMEQGLMSTSSSSIQTKPEDGFYKIPLWKHQLEAIQKARSLNEFALFFEMGTGKTATAINILRHWYKDLGQILPTLVFCPPVIIGQWAAEWSTHSNIASLVVQLKGSGKERLRLLQEGLASNKKIFITNYETLQMEAVFQEFLKARFQAIVCDEAHKLKSHDGKRTKRMVTLADQALKKLILTGTPILNGPMDLFSQFRILDSGKTFGKSFWEFRARYFYDKNAGMPSHVHFPDWRPRPGIEEVFNSMIYTKAMKADKKDCLDLPPLIRKIISVELSSKQQRMYEELREDFVAFVDNNVNGIGGNAIVTNNALVKILRMQEIVSGFYTARDISDEDAELQFTEEFSDNPRLAALQELLEDIVPSHKVIVWAPFRRNYAMIGVVCEKIKAGYVELNGTISAGQRDANIKRFKEDATCRVLVANPKAGGVGLNLVEASVCIYYARGYSLEDDLQSEARNYRGGSERHEKITRIDLVTPNTIDAQILDAIRHKKKVADNILAIRKQLEFIRLQG